MNKFILASLLIIGTVGCSMDAEVWGPKNLASIIAEPSLLGFASGSNQKGTATRGGETTYYVQSTLGQPDSGADTLTVENTYHVYSSVQGAMVSE